MVLVPIIGMNLLELIGAPTGGEGIGTWQLVGGFAAATSPVRSPAAG